MAGAAQPPGPRDGAEAAPEQRGGDVGRGVERDAERAENDALPRDRSRGRIQELRQEREEEGRRLGVERLDHRAVAEGAARCGRGGRGADIRRAKAAPTQPEQVERAGELQRGEQLGARQHQRRHADRAGRDVPQPARGRAERGRHALPSPAGEAARGDLHQPRPGRDRQQHRGPDEQEERRRFEHGHSLLRYHTREWPDGMPSSRPASTQPLRSQKFGAWKLNVSV